MNIKKKLSKVVIAVTVGFIAIITVSVTEVHATEEVKWASAKIPGSYNTSSTTKTMTYFAGTIYFTATRLQTDSSYVAGKCVGEDIDINNTNKCVLTNIINKPTPFKIKTVSDGRNTMKFRSYIEHNAAYSQAASGEGKIYY